MLKPYTKAEWKDGFTEDSWVEYQITNIASKALFIGLIVGYFINQFL